MKKFENYLLLFITNLLIRNTNLLLNFENFPNDIKLEKEFGIYEREFLQLEKNHFLSDIYTEFEKIFHKEYSDAEKHFRHKILKKNIKFIKYNNKFNDSFKMGLNQFADLDDEEFNQKMLMNDMEDIIKNKISKGFNNKHKKHHKRLLYDFFSGSSNFFGNKSSKTNDFEQNQYNKNLTTDNNFFSQNFFGKNNIQTKKQTKTKIIPVKKTVPKKTFHKYESNKFPKSNFFDNNFFGNSNHIKKKNPHSHTVYNNLPKKNLTTNNQKKKKSIHSYRYKINKTYYNLSEYPKKIDWAKKNKVTLIQNQGSCSLCYAFSSLAALESQLLIHKKARHNLSEQEILECTDDFNNKGCKGGLSGFVYDYIKKKGINKEIDYKYNGIKNKCSSKNDKKIILDDFDYVELDNHVLALIAALQFGPISVAHIVTKTFKYYNDGVLDEKACISKKTIPNHSSLLVGYDLDADVPFFRFKNSWGEKWGDSGYFNMKIGPLNTTNNGICLLAKYKINVLPIILG